MPEVELTLTMCPPSFIAGTSASFIRRIDRRLTWRTESQRSASVLASSLSRVMPALWTTMSMPPWRACGVLDDPGAGVLGGDVELEGRAAEAVGDLGERPTGGGDVDRDDRGPVAGQGVGDGGTDAAGGARDDRDLAGERLVPVGRGDDVADRRADAEDLAGDVGGAAGEQEAHRGVDAGVGALGHEDEVGGAPAAHLLADRADDPLEGAAGRGLRDRAGVLGRAPDDDDAAGRARAS